MTDEPPIILDEDSAIDSAFFGSHAGRTCYARAHRSGWVLVVRQAVAQREPPVMLRVWGRVERVPDEDASCLALWEVAPIRADAALRACAAFRIAARRGAGKGVAYLARNWKFESISLQRRVERTPKLR